MDKKIDVGDQVPDLTIATDGGGKVNLAELKGQKVVLYFYPKDDTPGCTKEACGFRDDYSAFIDSGAVVVGVSPDSTRSHDKFKAKYDLPFQLAADADKTLCERFGVWVEKSMYGRKYMGVERSTFVIDERGVVRKSWRKVKVPGHIEQVFAAIHELDNT